MGEDIPRWARELSDRIREAIVSSFRSLPHELEDIFRKFMVESAEKNGYIYLRIPLPGYSRDRISIMVREREVEVLAEPSTPPYEEVKQLFPHQRAAKHVIPLAKPVEAEGSDAKFVDGVLYVRLKVAEKKGVKIKIE